MVVQFTLKILKILNRPTFWNQFLILYIAIPKESADSDSPLYRHGNDVSD